MEINTLTEAAKLKLLAALVILLAAGYTQITADTNGNQIVIIDNTKGPSYEDTVKINVQTVDDAITAIQETDKEKIGLYSLRCDEAKQKINSYLMDVNGDVSTEHKALNGDYKAFLLEASSVVKVYDSKQTPDLENYVLLRDKINPQN